VGERYVMTMLPMIPGHIIQKQTPNWKSQRRPPMIPSHIIQKQTLSWKSPRNPKPNLKMSWKSPRNPKPNLKKV
jgi:hypothetical protein